MKETLIRYLAIGLAGSLGAITRYALAMQVNRLNFKFPLATFIINITGSIFLGWFLTFVAKNQVSDTTRLAIGVGFVGAYTTFSTFTVESNKLFAEGAGVLAMTYIIASVVIGILGVRLGILIAK
jgi:CrcB protein